MTYHFIGLGGIGMSALARILLQKGTSVQGSDIKNSQLLEQLASEGAQVHIGHRKEVIETARVVVYSTDIKATNVEFEEAKKKGLSLLHRSDLLNALLSEKKPLLVTGTHGKTTT
ncbi:MAG TPA: Mur ligase domain-containing protein, partial [Chlamydiales bacterium]